MDTLIPEFIWRCHLVPHSSASCALSVSHSQVNTPSPPPLNSSSCPVFQSKCSPLDGGDRVAPLGGGGAPTAASTAARATAAPPRLDGDADGAWRTTTTHDGASHPLPLRRGDACARRCSAAAPRPLPPPPPPPRSTAAAQMEERGDEACSPDARVRLPSRRRPPRARRVVSSFLRSQQLSLLRSARLFVHRPVQRLVLRATVHHGATDGAVCKLFDRLLRLGA